MVNRRFLDEGYEFDDKVGDARDHGKDLDDGCLDDKTYEDRILRYAPERSLCNLLE